MGNIISELPTYEKLLNYDFNDSNSSGIYEYDPNKIPPDFGLAKDHFRAMRIAKPFIVNDNSTSQNIDEASGLPVDNIELPLDFKTDDLSSFLSPGYSLYYLSMKFSLVVCLFITIISGFYNIIDNSKGDFCIPQEEYIKSNNSQACLLGFVTKVSMANQINKPGNVQDQGFVGFITIAILIIVLQFCRKQLRTKINECDENALTPSDYTIRVYNFPKDFDINCDVDEEVKTFFEHHGIPGRKLDVEQVSVIYDCKEKIELSKKIKNLGIERMKLLFRINNGDSEAKFELQTLEDELKESKTKINRLSRELEDGVGMIKKFTGEAFVIFKSQREAREVVKYWEMDIWKRLSEYFNSNSKYKYRGNLLRIARASEPSDVIWENAGITLTNRFIRQVIAMLLSLLLLAIGAIIVFIIQYEIKKQKHEHQLQQNKLMIIILSAIGSTIIISINYILNSACQKLAEFEKYSTKTDFLLNYSKNLMWAQFLNTAGVTLIISIISDNFFGVGGLLDSIFQVFLFNALIPMGTDLFNFPYLLRVWKRKKAIGNKGENMTQEELNKYSFFKNDYIRLFEDPEFNFARKYAANMKTLLSAALYAPLVPSILIIVTLSHFAQHWIDKYIMFRKSSRGAALGSEFAIEYIEILEYPLIIFSVIFELANLLFQYFMVKKYTQHSFDDIYSVIGALVGIIHAALPMGELNARLFPLSEIEISETPYSDIKNSFLENYDRSNPATSSIALEAFSSLRQSNLNKV